MNDYSVQVVTLEQQPATLTDGFNVLPPPDTNGNATITIDNSIDQESQEADLGDNEVMQLDLSLLDVPDDRLDRLRNTYKDPLIKFTLLGTKVKLLRLNKSNNFVNYRAIFNTNIKFLQYVNEFINISSKIQRLPFYFSTSSTISDAKEASAPTKTLPKENKEQD